MLDWKRYRQNLKDELKDLGFGSRVSSESRYRLLNKDGSFNVERDGLPFWESMTLYHFLIQVSWLKFYLIALGSYLVVNAIFALGYVALAPQALAGTNITGIDSLFLNAFFFSVQAFTTVGFGQVTPVGVAANVLFTFESFIGLLGFALVTGFMFARFSRPHAKIAFSEQALVAPYEEGTALMFRIANARASQLVELSAEVIFTCIEDGDRQFYPLALERKKITFFPLNWTIVHPIDEKSPLWERSKESFKQNDAEILILLSGFDETFSQTVHTRSSYKYDEITWNAEFESIFDVNEEGKIMIDMQGLSNYEEL
ncbi:inward rectifier potassium channel [Fodinibius salinus]|uniref:Inward rectifier potassium channel n=1 Tax=Fodinibius salinus TaxID=860790 RepID=A0A5D3YJN7_9BACT|nr:ion channel [Fodinibius salinus]TYP91942.1 inward rectifier potassium channel [Fodinibius salinus]